MLRRWTAPAAVLVACLPLPAQDLTPRVYLITPTGSHGVIVSNPFNSGDVLVDPSVPIEDAKVSFGCAWSATISDVIQLKVNSIFVHGRFRPVVRSLSETESVVRRRRPRQRWRAAPASAAAAGINPLGLGSSRGEPNAVVRFGCSGGAASI
jgi:hypothetical protein